MALSFIAMSHICEECQQDGECVECCGKLCRLRLFEEKEEITKGFK